MITSFKNVEFEEIWFLLNGANSTLSRGLFSETHILHLILVLVPTFPILWGVVAATKNLILPISKIFPFWSIFVWIWKNGIKICFIKRSNFTVLYDFLHALSSIPPSSSFSSFPNFFSSSNSSSSSSSSSKSSK